MAIGEGGALSVHDIPVELGRILLVRERRRQRDGAGCQLGRGSVGGPGRQDGVDIGLGDGNAGIQEGRAEALARRTGGNN